MALVKFKYVPDSAGYSASDPSEVIQVQLDGGSARYRRDKFDSSSAVSVTWTFNQGEYRYFRAFYRALLGRGALPFLIDLVIDQAELQEYTAHFVPGSVALTQQSGLTYVVKADLEVDSLPIDDEAEAYLVYMVNEFGDDWQLDEDDLNTLVNLELPEVL